MRLPSSAALLRLAALLTLFALALMVWSMLDPTPLPVMIAMSVAQAIGTLAFALFGLVVIRDLRGVHRVSQPPEDRA